MTQKRNVRLAYAKWRLGYAQTYTKKRCADGITDKKRLKWR